MGVVWRKDYFPIVCDGGAQKLIDTWYRGAPIEKIRGQVVIIMDADHQHRPETTTTGGETSQASYQETP